MTIAIGQIKDFLGLTFVNSPIETMDKLLEVFRCIGTFNWQALVVGMVCLLILIFWPKRLEKIPASLIAVVVGAAMVALLKMDVKTIGDLYDISSAPPKFSLPAFSFEKMSAVASDAFTIAILAAIESLLSCVVADGMIGSRHNSNMELVAQGAGNIASALFGGIPATAVKNVFIKRKDAGFFRKFFISASAFVF